MRFVSTPLVVCAVAAWLMPVSASGQSAPAASPQQPAPPSSDRPLSEQARRPYRGLFGAPADPTSKQSLDLTLSAFGAYDDDLLAADSGTSQAAPGNTPSGVYTGVTTGLAYNRRGDRVSGGLNGDIGVNHYPSLNRTTTMYRAGGALSARVARHTTFTLGADEVYATQYRLGLFVDPLSLTGEADPFATVATDFNLFNQKAYRTSAQGTLSQDLWRRASVSALYSLSEVNYVDNRFDYGSRTAGARFSQRLSRNLGFHAGYFREMANYQHNVALNDRRIHNIDVGVDYGRALSVSRRTKLSFSTGTSILSGNTAFTTPTNKFNYRFTGNADLRHEIGRSWTAALGYRRSVDFHEGFVDPFLSDGVTGSLGGFISRRLRFNSSADYAFGSVGLAGENNGYHSTNANAGLEYGLSRTWAFYGRYVYYHYNFDSGVVLDPRFTPTLDRQGVRVGVTASFPILR